MQLFHVGKTAALITWRSWEATWGSTGFLLLLRGKSGEYGLLPGALFVEGDMERAGFLWLLNGERGACECRLLSGTPSYSEASGTVAGILA